MKMPNFLIIGASKAGTTSLYSYLRQHPEIYMSPIKEPRFFAFENDKLAFNGPHDKRFKSEIITNIEDYRALFKAVNYEKAIGEVSPVYLYSAKAPHRIKHYIPGSKIIAVLRNPAERAYSSFLAEVRDGREPLNDFYKAIEDEDTRIRNNWSYVWHYTTRGFYHAQLTHYFNIFDRDQIRVYLYEEWKADNSSILRSIFRFLHVDETFKPDISINYNASLVPRVKFIDKIIENASRPTSILKKILPSRLYRETIDNIRGKNLAKPKLSSDIRKKLILVYREDILKLQDLIERDLSAWLEQ